MSDCRTRDENLAADDDADDAASPVEEGSHVDRRLLTRFVQTRDEAAFRELVERYTNLVLGVCLRVLRHRADAEEAFQAVFMVLAAKADRLEIRGSVGPWLYGVAYRVATRAAQKRARRREEALTADVMTDDDVLGQLADEHWRDVLDDELNRLPKRLREPLVQHYLFGKTNPEIAAELRLSVRTIEGRQRRGKAKLRRRLALRKVSLPLAVATLAAWSEALEAAPLEPLIDATVTASLSFAVGTEVAAGSEGAPLLARQEMLAMKLALAPAAVAATAVIVAGAALTIAAGDGSKSSDDPFAANGSKPKLVADDPFGGLSKEKVRDVAVEPIASPAADDPFGAVAAASRKSPPTEPSVAAPQTTHPQPSAYLPRLQSPQERRIWEALGADLKAPLDFIDRPLSDILDFLAQEYRFQTWLDPVGLADEGLSPDTEVTAYLRDVPLTSALALMLDQYHLTYLVKNDVLMITSVARAEAELEPRIYQIEDVGIQDDALQEAITTTVRPETWSAQGTGEGSIAILAPGLFSINQSQSVHTELAAYLEELRQYSAKTGGGF